MDAALEARIIWLTTQTNLFHALNKKGFLCFE
jgi:hypothetical protein